MSNADKCEVCGKEVPEWRRVCSNECTGILGARGYKKRQDLGIAKPRGFALLSPEKRKEYGRLGGRNSRRNRCGLQETR